VTPSVVSQAGNPGMEDYEQEKKIGQGAFGYVQACVRCVCGCDLYAEEKEDYKGKEGF
jgi:hypothetical protein